MKRLLLILLALFLLTGCTADTPETTVPATTGQPTEPPVPWIEQQGTPWNSDGSLVELPLLIPDGLHYTNAMAFNGDLLLWSIDDHLSNVRTLELCLVELDTGLVIGEQEFDFLEFVSPQVLGESIFLCDGASGKIIQLDPMLRTVNSWTIEPVEGNLHMGSQEKLYIYGWEGTLTVLDLKTGQTQPLLANDAFIDMFSPVGSGASFNYFHPETGDKITAILDFTTGEILVPDLQKDFTYVAYDNGTWLCGAYRDGTVFYIIEPTGKQLRADLGYDSISLNGNGIMVCTYDDGCHISIHDLQGKSIFQTTITENPYSHFCSALIPSDTFGGYFLLASDYNGAHRLLYWDTTKSSPGEDISFEPIPEPEEAELLIRQRVKELGEIYGLSILVGEDSGTGFYDFNAEQVTDWELVSDALNTLEDALDDYPEGFFRQLRYDTIRTVEIHLAGVLTATNEEYVETYEAFVQEEYDKQVMVVDIFQADQDTYYHEFSHIIDAYLAWDCYQRDDALFSEDGWNSLNPDWFAGYTWDYSWHQDVEDYSCFVDSYSTIRPTEDRARVLEYAMSQYGSWTFEDAPVLQAKLDYYCRCIRDAFDTTGWPERVLWEQYLP